MHTQITKSALLKIAEELKLDSNKINKFFKDEKEHGLQLEYMDGDINTSTIRNRMYIHKGNFTNIYIDKFRRESQSAFRYEHKDEQYTIKDTRTVEEVCKMLLCKNGKLSKYDADAVREIAKGGKLHGKETSGYGRHISILTTKYDHIKDVLDILNVGYDWGNDAPRGGKTGDYMEVTDKKEQKRLQKYIDYLLTKC